MCSVLIQTLLQSYQTFKFIPSQFSESLVLITIRQCYKRIEIGLKLTRRLCAPLTDFQLLISFCCSFVIRRVKGSCSHLKTMCIVLVILIVTILYIMYLTSNFDYWKKRNVKYDKPLPFFGNNLKIYLMKKSLTQMTTDAYRKYPNEKVVGLFRSSKPQLLIRDPEIVKLILATDFNHFYLRRLIPADDVPEPLTRHLFNADGDLWRLLRQRLTPAFTSGKLKAMFPLIVERAERLNTRILAAAGAPIDARDLMARFTTDFIGACGFGLDVDSLSDDTSEFRKLGIKIFQIRFIDAVKFFVKKMFPQITKNLKMTSRLEGDIIPLVQSIFKQRNYEPSGRNDFVDLLLECKKKGTIVGESMEKFKPDGTPEKATLEMTDDLMAAQMFVFFVAGFETSSSTTSFTLHQLAYHPEIQKKVQDEIDLVLSKHDNKLSYNAIQEMHYLEWAFKESMRMFPSVGFLIRECARNYKVPNLDLTIDEGVKILIPVQALQTDPKYFKNPEEFQPERFSPQEADNINKFTYLPFGDGPRACIGARLGLMQSLAGLAAVLSNFTVEPAPASLRYPIVETKPIMIQTIKGGLPLLFREKKKK